MRTKFSLKQTAYMGVDPGKSGCVALLLPEDKIKTYDWPKSNNYVEVHRQMRIWNNMFDIKFAVLERVGAMPGQGVTSCFTFGDNFGAWKMLLAGLSIKHIILTPQKWQVGLLHKSDGPEPKARVKNVVSRMFGYDFCHGPRGGYKDGRGDAALMAYKAKLLFGENKNG